MATENINTAEKLERLHTLAMDNVCLSDAIKGVSNALFDELIGGQARLRTEQLSFAGKFLAEQHGRIAGQIDELIDDLMSAEEVADVQA